MVFFKTEKVSVFRDESLYNYRIRNNSISTTGNERSFDIFEILDLTQDNLKNVNIYSKVKDDFLMFVIVNLKYVYLRLNERLKNQYLQKMKEKYEFYSLNQVKKDHLNTWHFDDRVFYQAIAVSSNGIEFELNYKKLYEAYSQNGRNPAVPPKILFKILIYTYMNDIWSSRKIELACKRDVNFMWLLEGFKAPDHNTIARFRTGRLEPILDDLFNSIFN